MSSDRQESELQRQQKLAGEGRVLDGRDCPVDGCDGDLVHQDSVNVTCEGECDGWWSLVGTDDAWELQNADAECEHELPILTPAVEREIEEAQH